MLIKCSYYQQIQHKTKFTIRPLYDVRWGKICNTVVAFSISERIIISSGCTSLITFAIALKFAEVAANLAQFSAVCISSSGTHGVFWGFGERVNFFCSLDRPLVEFLMWPCTKPVCSWYVAAPPFFQKKAD